MIMAIFMDVLVIKRAAAKIVPKLLNFWQTQRRLDIAQEMLASFNGNPDVIKKVLNWWRIMGVGLWHWNQKPNHSNGNVQSQDRKKGAQVQTNVIISYDCNGVVHH